MFKKKQNLQVTYVRDFRASILVWKDYKINGKTLRNYFSHIILQCIQAFRIIYIVQSCNKVFFPRHVSFLSDIKTLK